MVVYHDICDTADVDTLQASLLPTYEEIDDAIESALMTLLR